MQALIYANDVQKAGNSGIFRNLKVGMLEILWILSGKPRWRSGYITALPCIHVRIFQSRWKVVIKLRFAQTKRIQSSIWIILMCGHELAIHAHLEERSCRTSRPSVFITQNCNGGFAIGTTKTMALGRHFPRGGKIFKNTKVKHSMGRRVDN